MKQLVKRYLPGAYQTFLWRDYAIDKLEALRNILKEVPQLDELILDDTSYPVFQPQLTVACDKFCDDLGLDETLVVDIQILAVKSPGFNCYPPSYGYYFTLRKDRGSDVVFVDSESHRRLTSKHFMTLLTDFINRRQRLYGKKNA